MINSKTNKLACGCSIKTTHLGSMLIETTEYCQYHTKENRKKNKRIKENFEKRLKEAEEEIKCEICNKHICYVEASDLNCSYFICDTCKNN